MKSILYLRNLKLKRITTRLKLNPLYLLFHCIILQSQSEKNALNSIAQLFIHHALNISTTPNSLLLGLYFFCFSAFKNDVLQNIGLHVFIGPSLANLSLLRLLLLINIVSQAKMSTYLNSSLAFGLHLFLGPCFGLLRISTSMLSQTHEAKNSFRVAIPKVFL